MFHHSRCHFPHFAVKNAHTHPHPLPHLLHTLPMPAAPAIVQGWMAPKTTEKVKVISDVTQAREVLSEVIDLELLPTLVVAAS